MNLNGKTIKLLRDVEDSEVKKGGRYFYANRFSLFALAIASKKPIALNAIIEEKEMGKEEVSIYIETLEKHSMLSDSDRKLIETALKKKKKMSIENYDEEVREVIAHFNRVARKRARENSSVRTKIEALLKSGFSVKDLKKVSLFYTMLWSGNPKMSQYVDMNTYFRKTKFEEKLARADEFFEKLDHHKPSIKKFCKEFKSMIVAEYMQRGKLTRDIACNVPETPVCDDIPLQLQQTLIHWLENGYTIDEIIVVIHETLKSWSKNPEIAQKATLSKILDEAFPKRAAIVKRIIEKRERQKAMTDEWDEV